MSAVSKNSPENKPAIDRPFDPAILKRARKIADQYQVIIRREDGEWFGRGLELPNAHEDGATPAECVRKTREMFVTVIAYLLEKGDRPPTPHPTRLGTSR